MSQHILLPEDVEVIWERLQAGESGRLIAQDFAVAQQTVSAINTGKIWNSVTHLVEPPPPDANKHRSKLTRTDALEIDRLIDEGLGTTAIASLYDVSCSAISQIKSGKTWSDVTGRGRESNVAQA